MRVLTTEAGQEAGYSVVRCLRALAEFVAVGYYGPSPRDIGRSRYVDAAFPLELPKALGPGARELGAECSAAEYRWVEDVLRFCRRERIDAVVPTNDSEVYALAKARATFEAEGIDVPVPKFALVRRLLDKHDAPALVRDAGLPVAAFVEIHTAAQARSFAREFGFPVVVKERLGYFSAGVRLVADERGLDKAVEDVRSRWDSLVVQEYVPGSREPSLMIVLSDDARAQEAYVVRKLRYVQSSFSTCVQSAPPIAELEGYVRFAEAQQIRGTFVVQLKEDARDGSHRLMETNLRLGANSRILTRMALRHGFNPVRATLEPGAGAMRTFPAGIVGVSPVEDLMAIGTYARARRSARVPPDNPPPSPSKFARGYARTYLGRSRVLDWFAASLATDPRAVVGSYVRNTPILAGSRPSFIPWGEE